MGVEGSRHFLLGCQQSGQVDVDFTNLAICARRRHTITVRGRRRPAHEMVAFVRGENKKRVATIDAVVLKTGKEFAKGIIIRFQRGYIPCLTWAVSCLSAMVVVRI